jgi:cation diffusion facilitator CzcD-associated flavoprotein CzcO
MHDTHGVAALRGLAAPTGEGRANQVVPAYFADYEARFQLPVVRPVRVRGVAPLAHGRLEVTGSGGTWRTRTVVNATGTWSRPFIPHYRGVDTFRGRQLHTATYAGAGELAGGHVVVVGGGASAVQLLAEISEVATTTWVTADRRHGARRPSTPQRAARRSPGWGRRYGRDGLRRASSASPG